MDDIAQSGRSSWWYDHVLHWEDRNRGLNVHQIGQGSTHESGVGSSCNGRVYQLDGHVGRVEQFAGESKYLSLSGVVSVPWMPRYDPVLRRQPLTIQQPEVFVRKIDALSGFSQRGRSNPALLGSIRSGVRHLAFQDVDLLLSGSGRPPVRPESTQGASGRSGEQNERPQLDPMVEANLRLLFGVPLLLIGIWLVRYGDRALDNNRGWGLLALFIAFICISASFILLAYRGRLASLRELL